MYSKPCNAAVLHHSDPSVIYFLRCFLNIVRLETVPGLVVYLLYLNM